MADTEQKPAKKAKVVPPEESEDDSDDEALGNVFLQVLPPVVPPAMSVENQLHMDVLCRPFISYLRRSFFRTPFLDNSKRIILEKSLSSSVLLLDNG